MVFIIDSPKYGKKEVLIDDEDFDKIKDYKWCVVKKNNDYYVRQGGINNYLHRFLMNPEGKEKVDHKNKNTLDDRKENLRRCSHKENVRNQSKHKNNTSGYKGVFLHERIDLKKRWFSKIGVNRKIINLGYFETKDQAAIAYNMAALKYHGEYAQLNNVMAYNNAR